MASRAFHDLLLQSHDNLLRNGRGSFCALLALLLFHVAVIAPFADAGRRKAEAAADRQRLATVGPALDEAEHRLGKVFEAALKPIEDDLDAFSENLALDLRRLEASRWQWQQSRLQGTDDGDGAEATAGSADDALDASLQMTEAPRGAVPWPIAEDRRAELAEAPNRYALLSLLEPLVDETILGPRRQALEQAWKTSTLPSLQAGVDEMGGEVSRLRARFPEAATSWDALAAALNELARAAEQWQPQTPSQPYWWASAESEPRLSLGLGEFEESLKRPANLDQLVTIQDQVIDRLAAVRRAWQRRQAEIPAADATPIGFLGLDLDGLTPLFPLVLGLLLAAALWRRTRLQDALATATAHAIAHGSPAQLAQWFGTVVAAAGPASPSVEELPLSQLLRTARRRLLGQLLLAGVWLAATGYQLYGVPTSDWQPWTPACAGIGLVLLAGIHRWLSLGRSFGRLSVDTEAHPGADEPTPQIAEADDLAEPTLRR